MKGLVFCLWKSPGLGNLRGLQEFRPFPVKVLGFVPFGVRSQRARWHCFLSSILHDDTENPSGLEAGTLKTTNGHSKKKKKRKNKKGISFSGLLWLILQLCKYVPIHFQKKKKKRHVFMSLTVNVPFLKFYNSCYLMKPWSGCSVGLTMVQDKGL